MYIYDWTYALLLPALLLGIWAQIRVKSAYKKGSEVVSQQGISADQVAARLLSSNGNNNVTIEHVSGNLTDHYDPRSETLRLSDGVYHSSSLAALGIAAHEAGHAMQKMDGYLPLKLRNAVLPAVQFGSRLYGPLFILGLILSWSPLVTVGIIFFSLTVIFSLITLPVEFNASSRAIAMLTQGGYITRNEEPMVKKVLSAAALTYVASAVTAILQLVRLIALRNRRND